MSTRWTATNSQGYPAPAALAVDAVALTVRDGKLLALVVHGLDGRQALPGGLVGATESTSAAAVRKLSEKTGLDEIYLEQMQAFTEPDRDPRGWIPSVAHLALVPPETVPTDPKASWVSARRPPKLAFDHNQMLCVALERIEGKLWWSNVAVGILAEPFTMADAREVYDALAGRRHNPGTFGRDLRKTGLVEPTGEMVQRGPGRPAQLYTFVKSDPTWGVGRKKRASLQ